MAGSVPAALGRFLVTELVEETDSVQVYRGVHQMVGERVLITRERRPRAAEPALRDLRVAEARRRVALRGPHLGRFFELDFDGDHAFVAEADVPGRALSERLAEGPVMVPELERWLGPIADELALAHEQGLVHGAVAPRRIVLREDGTAVLTGWGPGWLGRDGPGAAADDRQALAALLPGLSGRASRAVLPGTAQRPAPAKGTTSPLRGPLLYLLALLLTSVAAYVIARNL
jgi:hypothetical protein